MIVHWLANNRRFITGVVASLCSLAASTNAAADVAIAIHGGAGTIARADLTPEQDAAYRAKLNEALDAGHAVLSRGGSSLDAVVTAIQVMEESPFFNAGRGAVYTWDEQHELDASIMRGSDLDAGAVAGVKTIKSPIAAARAVMEKSVHVMLSGEGAEAFSRDQGLEQVDNSYFDTERRLKSLQKAKSKIQTAGIEQAYAENPNYKFGTVGAVALDSHGNLAAGTSTGGMTAKRWGRIGDSPIIGAGTYADNASCAVSATGHGEYFIRHNVASDICARVKYLGVSVSEAGDQVLHGVLSAEAGEGGVIIMDSQGNIAMPFNSEGMYRGSIATDGTRTVQIYKDE